MITLIKFIAITLLVLVAATVRTFVYNLYIVLREAQYYRFFTAGTMVLECLLSHIGIHSSCRIQKFLVILRREKIK